MFFGPGAPPATPPKSSSPCVTIDHQKAEDDIARAFEICRREIPPPDPACPRDSRRSPSTPTSSEKPAVLP